MKSVDLGSNRFDTIRANEFPKWNVDDWIKKVNDEKSTENQQEEENQQKLINEFYKLTNFFIKEGMFLNEPTYQNLRTVVYECDSIIKKDNVLFECTIKEAIRRIELSKIKHNSPFVRMLEVCTPEDIHTFKNIVNYHNQKKK